MADKRIKFIEADAKAFEFLVNVYDIDQREFDRAADLRRGRLPSIKNGRLKSVTKDELVRIIEQIRVEIKRVDRRRMPRELRDATNVIIESLESRHEAPKVDLSFLDALRNDGSAQDDRYSKDFTDNPAADPRKHEKVSELVRAFSECVSELRAVNDEDSAEYRDLLIALLRALLAFLGDGSQNPPKKLPRSLPNDVGWAAEKIKEADKTATATVRLAETVSGWVDKLTSSQAHKLTSSQAHKLTSSQAHKLTSSQAHKLTSSQAHKLAVTLKNSLHNEPYWPEDWLSGLQLQHLDR